MKWIAIPIACVGVVIQLGCARRHTLQSVPQDFQYPEYGISVELATPRVARQIVGMVVDPNGRPVEKALIEILDANSHQRVSARFTDKSGRFAFAKMPNGTYHLKVTQYGYKPLLLTVVIQASGANELKLVLNVAV